MKNSWNLYISLQWSVNLELFPNEVFFSNEVFLKLLLIEDWVSKLCKHLSDELLGYFYGYVSNICIVLRDVSFFRRNWDWIHHRDVWRIPNWEDPDLSYIGCNMPGELLGLCLIIAARMSWFLLLASIC